MDEKVVTCMNMMVSFVCAAYVICKKISVYDNRNDRRCSLCVCVRLPSFLKASSESAAPIEGEGLFFSFMWVVETQSDCTGLMEPPSIG